MKEKNRILPQFKAIEYLAIATMVVLPLWGMKGSLYRFTSAKSFLFAGIVAIMLLLWAWGQWNKREAGVRCTWIHAFLAFFALSLGLSAFFGVNPSQSWFGTFQYGTGVAYIYLFIIWAMLVGTVVHRKGFLPRFLLAAFVSGIIVSIATFFNESGGPIGNSSFAGTCLLFCGCFGVGLVWWYQQWWQKLAAGIGTLVILLCPMFINKTLWSNGFHGIEAVIGQAQGAAMGLVLSLAVISLFAAIRSRKAWLQWSGVVLFIMLLIGLWHGGRQFMNPDTALHQYVVEHKSANRFLFWDIARAGLIDRPLTGYGWGNYELVLQQHFNPLLFTPGYVTEPSITQSHNVIWEYAATTGSMGLIAYMALFGAVFVSLFAATRGIEREKRIFSIALAGVLVGYLFQNMFVFDTPITYLMYFSVIGIAIGLSKGKETVVHPFLMRTVLVVVGVISIAVFVWLSVLPWHESLAWTRSVADRSIATGRSPQHLSPVGTSSDTAYIASKLYARGNTGELSQLQKDFFKQKFSLFAGYLEEDIAKGSINYKTYLIKGILGNGLVALSGKLDDQLVSDAYGNLEIALALNPNTPEIYFNLVQAALYKKNINDAYMFLRAGIVLAPEYVEGYSIGKVLLQIKPDKSFEDFVKKVHYNTN